MGWVDSLRGTVVGVDTMPLIYFLEEHPTYLPVVDPFFAAIGRNEFTIVTSTISLLEGLVHPIRNKNTDRKDAKPKTPPKHIDILLQQD